MASSRKYQSKYYRWHNQYSRRAYKELRKVFKVWGVNIPWDTLTEENWKAEIKNALDQGIIDQAYYDMYVDIGLAHGKRVGVGINAQLKAFGWESFQALFMETVTEFLRKWGVNRIMTVSNTYFNDIVKIMEDRIGVDHNKNIRDVAKEVEKLVNSPKFYRWQAERIARTEATAASNFSAIQAGDVSGYIMEKVWISAMDNRTRRLPRDAFDHRRMHMKTTQLAGKFEVPFAGKMGNGVEYMDYPGDPTGSAGNVINCRCTVAVVPKRGKDGRLIPTE